MYLKFVEVTHNEQNNFETHLDDLIWRQSLHRLKMLNIIRNVMSPPKKEQNITLAVKSALITILHNLKPLFWGIFHGC